MREIPIAVKSGERMRAKELLQGKQASRQHSGREKGVQDNINYLI